MALIRLRVCAGWSEPLLAAHVTMMEISCCGSYILSAESGFGPTCEACWMKQLNKHTVTTYTGLSAKRQSVRLYWLIHECLTHHYSDYSRRQNHRLRTDSSLKVYVLHVSKPHSHSFTRWRTQWLSCRLLGSIPRGCGFKPHRCHCVVSLMLA